MAVDNTIHIIGFKVQQWTLSNAPSNLYVDTGYVEDNYIE